MRRMPRSPLAFTFVAAVIVVFGAMIIAGVAVYYATLGLIALATAVGATVYHLTKGALSHVH